MEYAGLFQNELPALWQLMISDSQYVLVDING